VIVQSLARYYDILANDENVKISRPGYSRTNVSFILKISKEGDLTHLIDWRIDDKKAVSNAIDVPLQKGRSGKNPPPHFLCDKIEYIFGVEIKKKNDFEKKYDDNLKDISVLAKNDKHIIFVSKYSRSCFESFKKFHHKLLDGLENTDVKAFLKFLDAWKPESFIQHHKTNEAKDILLNGGLFIFEINGNFLHKNHEVKNVWEKFYESDNNDSENYDIAQCLISGQIGPISRLHQDIIGVKGVEPKGRAPLVSFNDPSFCSYGKTQSNNAPVSKISMFKYSTTLNHLLEWDSKNKILIGDTTTVFWAESTNQTYVKIVHALLTLEDDDEAINENKPKDGKTQDKSTNQLILDVLKKVKYGRYIQEYDFGLPNETNFFILGLAPNKARIAIKFWYQDNFGNFVSRLALHYQDMEIVKGDYGSKYVSIPRLLRSTLPRKRSKKSDSNQTDKRAKKPDKIKNSDIPPLLGDLLFSAIISNRPYPPQLYNAILKRAKTGSATDYVQLDYVHAGFIKAYLTRLARTGLSNLKEDLITVSLNKENPNIPYRLGRLFAILESAQKAANPEIKRTIRDSYFASASSTPGIVYPILLKLSQHHLSKINSEKPGWGVNISKSMDEVMSSIDQFPVHLSLEKQGMFMLGYYHQHESFFRKDDEAKKSEDGVEEK
jgi:CRISPR-associated protein Csd1